MLHHEAREWRGGWGEIRAKQWCLGVSGVMSRGVDGRWSWGLEGGSQRLARRSLVVAVPVRRGYRGWSSVGGDGGTRGGRW